MRQTDARADARPGTLGPHLATSTADRESRIQSYAGYLGTHRLFGALSKPALLDLARTLLERTYPKGHFLFQAGDAATHLFLVRSGLVSLTELDERGHPHPILTFSVDDTFGLAATLLGLTRSSTAIAITDVQALLVPKAAFERLYNESADLARHVTRELCWMLYRSERTTFHFTRTSVASRIAWFLLEASGGSRGITPRRLELSLSHHDLALLLGTSRETVTRVLARFSRAGIIRSLGQGLLVLRPDLLHQFTDE